MKTGSGRWFAPARPAPPPLSAGRSTNRGGGWELQGAARPAHFVASAPPARRASRMCSPDDAQFAKDCPRDDSRAPTTPAPPAPDVQTVTNRRARPSLPRTWLTLPMPCSHLPPLCTAGAVRLQATFEHAAGWMRAREEEQQARVWGKVGSTEHSSCVRRGCTWGQRSSQRADTGEPWAHRAMWALACPTARGGWHVVAICGRPGHICARIRVGGAALLRLRAGWDRGQPEHTPSSHVPLDWHGSLVRAVHRVCAWTRNDTRDV